MPMQNPATDPTAADPTPSSDDEEAREQVTSPSDFLKGEWRNLWPVWTLLVIFAVLIILASFGEVV